MRTRSLSITEVYSYLLRVPPVLRMKTTIYKYTHVACIEWAVICFVVEHVQRNAVSAARDRHRVRTYGRYIHMHTYTRKPDRLHYTR